MLKLPGRKKCCGASAVLGGSYEKHGAEIRGAGWGGSGWIVSRWWETSYDFNRVLFGLWGAARGARYLRVEALSIRYGDISGVAAGRGLKTFKCFWKQVLTARGRRGPRAPEPVPKCPESGHARDIESGRGAARNLLGERAVEGASEGSRRAVNGTGGGAGWTARPGAGFAARGSRAGAGRGPGGRRARAQPGRRRW